MTHPKGIRVQVKCPCGHINQGYAGLASFTYVADDDPTLSVVMPCGGCGSMLAVLVTTDERVR